MCGFSHQRCHPGAALSASAHATSCAMNGLLPHLQCHPVIAGVSRAAHGSSCTVFSPGTLWSGPGVGGQHLLAATVQSPGISQVANPGAVVPGPCTDFFLCLNRLASMQRWAMFDAMVCAPSSAGSLRLPESLCTQHLWLLSAAFSKGLRHDSWAGRGQGHTWTLQKPIR